MAEETQPNEILALMREVLGSNYTDLQVQRVVVEEDLVHGSTSITCELTSDGESPETMVIAGKGVGLIDAFFAGVQSRFAEEYPSLKTIRFSSFTVEGQLDTKQEFAGTDSQAAVTVEIVSSEERVFRFSYTSRSFIAAAIVSTLEGLEYFINSERAFVTMYHARQDAEERRRPDLVQRYTSTMAKLVQNTSYSEVIDKLRTELEG